MRSHAGDHTQSRAFSTVHHVHTTRNNGSTSRRNAAWLPAINCTRLSISSDNSRASEQRLIAARAGGVTRALRTVGDRNVVRLKRLDALELLAREGEARIDGDPPRERHHAEAAVPATRSARAVVHAHCQSLHTAVLAQK